MLSKVILIGHLGRDPELRHINSGKAVCTFSVATSKAYKDQSGQWKELTEWHNITTWDTLAERCAKLTKGAKVYIEGELKTDKYQKDGQDHYATKVVAHQVKLLDRKEKEQPASSGWDDTGQKPQDDLPF